MMFIDSSALVALLTHEPDAERIAAAIEGAPQRFTSGLVRLETVMRTTAKLRVAVEDANASFDALLMECAIAVVPITDAIGREAVAAFAAYGKGHGHPARLNLADCLVYATAKACQCPLLFIGDDFAQTDIVSALEDPAPTIA